MFIGIITTMYLTDPIFTFLIEKIITFHMKKELLQMILNCSNYYCSKKALLKNA